MHFIDRATHRVYSEGEFVLLQPRAPLRGCELLVFVLRDYSRVFVGGGEWGFDSLAREADEVEIEALVQRFGWEELNEVLTKRRSAMTWAEAPTFPVLLQSAPETKWQRSLIPIRSSTFDDVPGDSPGWVANGGYRIIDRDRRVFTAAYDGATYAFAANGTMTDEELRELMFRNFRSLGRSSRKYVERASSLRGHELFDFTFQTAQALPMMSTAMRLGGCALIALLCVMAVAIPATLIWWIFR
jgi:hypothetical protein